MTYRSPSTGRQVHAIVFDTFGTVVDWRTGISTAVAAFARRHDLDFDAAVFADAWRAHYQPAMQRIRAGDREFVDLDTLHRENLDEVLQSYDVDVARLPADDLEALARSWRLLPPWPDSVAGIEALKPHFVTGPLSNANTSLLVDMARHGGLPWDVVLGSDVWRAYKPDAAAYRGPAQLLKLDVGEVMLVAAHNSDLAAARDVGLATGFVARPLEHGAGQTKDLVAEGDWDVSATSITELADAIAAAGGP